MRTAGIQTKIRYEQELNPAQQEAVFSTEGPHLVIAGAGSGKTRVLVFRTAYLVERGVDPRRILLLTFTRRAAGEMLARAAAVLDDRCQQVAGGTFHSFAHRVLRHHAPAAGLSPSFSILDQSDAEASLQTLRTKFGYNKQDRRFPRKQALLAMISACRNRGEELGQVLLQEYPHFLEWEEAIQLLKREYQEYKRQRSLLDFDDLLIDLRDLLRQDAAVRKSLSEYYQYIMVDEYQDTNSLQAEITSLLASEHNNVMVVGDDAQSIYSFRGANFRNIIRFPELFPGTRRIMLEQNYRSTQPILNLTNAVIRQARERYDKELFTRRPGDNLPVYMEVSTENSQSRYVARQIERLLDQGVPLSEIAVLFRTGWHSNDLEVELAGRGIAFVKFGGQRFVEAAHIKDVISFLQVAYQPGHEPALVRILTMLRGIGEQTAARLARAVAAAPDFNVPAKAVGKHSEAARLFVLFRQVARNALRPAELLEHFMGFYVPLMPELYDDYNKRIYDLESLRTMAERYADLETFLADMALDPPETGRVQRERDREEGDFLTLSTIHSAKGLEWHTVFILYVAEGYLPSYQSMENPDGLEEERRLFYVAATRAKDQLYLLRPQIDRSGRFGADRYSLNYTQPSRFLIEGDLIFRHAQVERDETHHSPSWDLI